MAANPTRSNEQDKQKDCVPGGGAPQTLQLVGNPVHGHNYQPCPQLLTVCETSILHLGGGGGRAGRGKWLLASRPWPLGQCPPPPLLPSLKLQSSMVIRHLHIASSQRQPGKRPTEGPQQKQPRPRSQITKKCCLQTRNKRLGICHKHLTAVS